MREGEGTRGTEETTVEVTKQMREGYTWQQAMEQFEQDDACRHSGVECELQLLCSQGCNCQACQEAIRLAEGP